jgi:hypothetical protein
MRARLLTAGPPEVQAEIGGGRRAAGDGLRVNQASRHITTAVTVISGEVTEKQRVRARRSEIARASAMVR